MSAPERIWWNVAPLPHSYTSTVHFSGGTEYRRADLPPTDADYAALQARVAELEAERDARIDPDYVQGLVDLAEPMLSAALGAAEGEIAALQARVAELEALVKDDEEQAKWVGRMTDDWIAAEARADAADAAEALLSEAVKAGMMEVVNWEDNALIDSIQNDPETIARIVAQLKEGRG